jgi:peptidoglycan/xylan/chitin deacetylase (PgdA/CDA1 family)
LAEGGHPLIEGLGGAIQPDLFEAHLAFFARNFDVISAEDLLVGQLPRRPLLVTFDDAYRSVLDIAGPLLKHYSAPSLFFLNAATISQQRMPIDNVIAYGAQALGLPRVLQILNAAPDGADCVDQIIATLIPPLGLRQVQDAKAAILAAAGASEADLRRDSGLFLQPNDIPRLAEFGIAVGNHTANHSFLRSLSEEELIEEIDGGRRHLEALSGTSVKHFSVPYGNARDATSAALTAIRGSGHAAIYLVHGKSNRFGGPSDVFYRTSFSTTPVRELALRLRVMPVLRSIRDGLH